jgi:hypothetical protein
VTVSSTGFVSSAGGYPTIRDGKVFAAFVRLTNPTPNDHFTAGPHCRVPVSDRGRIGCAGGCPTIRTGIVSAAVVQIARWVVVPAPNDHFTAGPHCRVSPTAGGRVGQAGGYPTIRVGIVSAAAVQAAIMISTQTIISLPVQTAVWPDLPVGALVKLVAIQLSVLGLYLPPVLK